MKKNVWIAGMTAILSAGLVWLAPVFTLADERIPDGVSVGAVSLSGLTEEEAEKQIESYVNEKLNQDITLVVNGTEAKSDAQTLGVAWDNQDEVAEAIQGTELKGNLVKRYMKKKDLEVNPVKIELDLSVDQDKVSSFVSEKCGSAVAGAVDATITRKDGKFEITPSKEGLAVDMDATKAALNEALNSENTDAIRVEASVTVKKPKVTEEDLATIKDVLGTFSTSFATSGASRSTNLAVWVQEKDQRTMWLMPGRSALRMCWAHAPVYIRKNGYKTATAYENGKSVDSIGGGVCQISTTLYNASLYAELEIVQRQNHSMSVSYVKPSMDAAIAGTYKDLKVKNPYDTPIYVEGYTKGKTLTFTIYGKETRPSNRTLAFESETLSTTPSPTQEIQDPSLPAGKRVKVESGHTGLKSKLYKCVYVGGQLQERTLLNSDTYNASKTVYRVGTGVAAPAETTSVAPAAPAETEAAAPAETAAPETQASETAAPETAGPQPPRRTTARE
ncbi:MAG: VanW family protein [Clostridiaceae bacterium]